MKKKAKLILGGGSAYGLAHIGAVAALQEQYDVTGIIGTSMGAIVGACFACCYSPAEILELALEYRTEKLFSPLSIDLHSGGIFDGKAVHKLFLDWTHKKKIEDCSIPFIAVAYDLAQKRSVLIDKGSLADAMRASSSLPYVFSPYHLGKYLFVDGGVEHPLPLAFQDEVPGDVVIAVNVLPHVSIEAEKIDLSSASVRSKLRIHQVFVQSLMQNQAYIAIQEMLDNRPDIYIDAHNPALRMIDLPKARQFYNYGYTATEKALQRNSDTGFTEQLLGKYQEIMNRIRRSGRLFRGL